MYIMLLARGAGGAGLAGCSSCFNALSNSPGLASGFMRLRTRLVRVDAGTAAFQAVRGLVLAWPAIAAGHFASRLDAILLDAFTPFRPDRRCALLAAARPASVAGRLTVADTLCSFQRRPPSTRTAMAAIRSLCIRVSALLSCQTGCIQTGHFRQRIADGYALSGRSVRRPIVRLGNGMHPRRY